MTTIDNCYQLNAGIGKNNLFQYILPDHSMAKSVTLAANECDGEMIVVEVCEWSLELFSSACFITNDQSYQKPNDGSLDNCAAIYRIVICNDGKLNERSKAR